MISHTKNRICIIPIRSGSKTIKDKNIKLIKKRPLIFYSLNEAIKSKIFREIIISTDSKKYIDVISKLNINKKIIKFHQRSKLNSSSKSSTEDVLIEVLNYYSNEVKENEIINLVQATSPQIKSQDLIMANILFSKKRLDSLFSASRNDKFIWKNGKNIKPINYNFKKRPRRQEQRNDLIIENGAFYIFKKKNFLKNKNRLHKKIGFFQMPKYRSFEIDNFEDLNLIKKIL